MRSIAAATVRENNEVMRKKNHFSTRYFDFEQLLCKTLDATPTMRIITTAHQMRDIAENKGPYTGTVGFVPTMGALHPGHISLIRRAKSENSAVVVSVFVNPTQFNDASDLNAYPRTYAHDRKVLEQEKVDVMFHPEIKEIYPTEERREYELDGLDAYMEGPNRPGHFNGVVQVVTRLFDLVQPTSAYFGEKDFQQLAIIRHMTAKLGYRIGIIGCPTFRESDGLAMSSRNVRLCPAARTDAARIHAALCQLKEGLREKPLQEALDESKRYINSTENLILEYLELVDPTTLRPIENEKAEVIRACVAVQLGGVRLIDNLKVK